MQILSDIRLIFEVISILTFIILQSSTFNLREPTKIITFLLIVVNSFIIFVSAKWYGRSFQRLLNYINDNHSKFICDGTYLNSLEGRYKTLKILLLCYGLFIPIFLYQQYELEEIHYYFYFNLIFCNARYITEYIVMYSVLSVLTEHVMCISRHIGENIKVFEGKTETVGESAAVEPDEFVKWTKAYTNVKETSNLFNTIFGVQITVILITAMLNFIIFLYNVTYISVSGRCGTTTTVIYYSVKLLTYIVALFMLSRSAYALQTSADFLRRKLVKLMIHCPITHSSHRATKDLLRLVATRKLRTRAFGSMPIDMTLLPSSVMFFTSYTVIALQFNNVV